MKKFWNYLYNTILALIIIFAIVAIVSTLQIFGYQIFVVKSGSMQPEIKTGSIVVDKKEADYRVGDVVTFFRSSSKDSVTHRIFKIFGVGKTAMLQTKGDANNAPDIEQVPSSDVVGKVQFSVPYVGYIIAFIKSVPGLIIFIIIPATIIIYEEARKIKDEIVKISKEAKKEEKKISRWFKNKKTEFSAGVKESKKEAKNEKDGDT